ncbi:MAG: hypothetical protein OEV93_03620 [Candidatus Moranbacteria bacterium]|nr:hypothetical protein [Candidatus Moranbacteria bacterium]
MENLNDIEQRLNLIEERNKRVEMDKAWETSWERRVAIVILTYFVIVLFFFMAGLSKPFISSIVPAVGFVLSTLSLSFLKKRWVERKAKN